MEENENKTIVLSEKVQLDDKKPTYTAPVKGIAVLKKEDGTIVFKKHNMVVLTGRQLLRDLFYYALGTTDIDARKAGSLSIVIGTGTGTTTDSYGTESFTNAQTYTISSANIETSTGSDLYIKFVISLSGTGLTAINMSELGLVMNSVSGTTSDAEETEELLFSRIVFDPIPFTSSTTYTLEYYIYF